MEQSTIFFEEFKRDGYYVLEDFIDKHDVEAMKKECWGLVDEMDPSKHHTVFNAETQSYRDNYFLNSGDNISYFFEDKALDKDGELIVDKHASLNKIGHALHTLCQSFKSVTFSDRMKAVVKHCGFDDPIVCQSMYIFKQPKIGGAVVPHQDGTFLYTDPLKLMGVWIALEDCTLNNGCLSFIPGSQKAGLLGGRRMIRSGEESGPSTVFIGEEVEAKGEYITVPVKAGSVILIDGLVVHKSLANHSENSRHIYTFHLYEGSSKWSPENWMQPTKENTFVHMFH